MFVHSKKSAIARIVFVLSSSMMMMSMSMIMTFHAGKVMGEEAKKHQHALRPGNTAKIDTVESSSEHNSNNDINILNKNRRNLASGYYVYYDGYECRTSSGTAGTQTGDIDFVGGDYHVFSSIDDWEECQDRCDSNDYCWGFEWSPGRCENWDNEVTYGIDHFERNIGFTCAVWNQNTGPVGPPPPTPTPPVAPLYYFQAGHLCRTAEIRNGAYWKGEDGDEYDLRENISSEDQCKQLCNNDLSCKGFEYNLRNGRCELWQETPCSQCSVVSNDSNCWIKETGQTDPGQTCPGRYVTKWECW